jgi:hypothetical protein
MAGGLTGADAVDSATWRENIAHDPLALTNVNTEIFKNDDGTFWSYYHVMEQVLGAMQLRIMMQMVDYGTDKNAMWLLQSPFVYHDSSGNIDTDILLMLHGNDLTTNSALSYINNWSTKLTNPESRLSGGLTTFVAPYYEYTSIYEHKIMQNLALGPVSFDSQEWSENNGPNTGDINITTEPNGFAHYITEDNTNDAVGWSMSQSRQSKSRLLITGKVQYYPYLWFAWDYFNANCVNNDFFSPYEYLAFFNQMVSARLGLKVGCRSEFEGTDPDGGTMMYTLIDYCYFGTGGWGYFYGNIPWEGPGEVDVGAGNYRGGYPNDMFDWPTVPQVYGEDGNLMIPYGIDWGFDAFPFFQNMGATDTFPTYNDSGYFTPYIHHVQGILLGYGPTGGFAGNDYMSFLYAYSVLGVEAALTSPEVSFSLTTPKLPIFGNQYGEYASAGGTFINHLDLVYGFGRDLWPNDMGGPGEDENYYCCALDYFNQQELLHKNRGIGFGYSLSEVRVYVLGPEDQENGYYDYSIGVYTNENGNPTESDTQDPEIIIGDDPQYNTYLDAGIDGLNIGTTLIYFGQFWFTNTNPATNTNNPFYIGVESVRWININESLNDTNWDMLHIKRAKAQVAHHYKLKERLDLTFRDRSPESAYSTDFQMTDQGFSSLFAWYGAGSTEQSTWIGNIYLVTGGEFIAGTMEWKVQLTDCLTFSESNLVNNSYSSNNN